MASKQHAAKNQADSRSRPRPRIALLVDTIDRIGGYQHNIWTGALDAARERDANLLCFTGMSLRSPYGFEMQANAIYDLVGPENVDGVIVLTGALCGRLSPEDTKSFLNDYQPLPIVSVGLRVKDVPSLLVDNEKGLRDVLVHLIKDHGYRRIAFIRGPSANEEAQNRYRTYARVLAEHGLTLDHNLIVSGDFVLPSGIAATDVLLEERQASFDAIVAANDLMALGALEALHRRGMRVPYDVVVVGFDDEEATRFATPPLTTVRQPMLEIGRHAVEMLLALLAGEQVPEEVVLQTEAVVRQSCGCLSPALLQTRTDSARQAKSSLETGFAERQALIVSEIAPQDSSGGPLPEQAARLLDAFTAETRGEPSPGFLFTLDVILNQTAAANRDVMAWQKAVSILRRHALPYLSGDALSRAEDVWGQARVMIGEVAQRVQASIRLHSEQQATMLRTIGQSLITTVEMASLIDVVSRELPQMGIPGCYLSLYEGKSTPSERARLILAYDAQGRMELGSEVFPSRQLVPGDLTRPPQHCNMVISPLYFREDQLGFVLFEVGLREGPLYEALRGQLSSSMEAALIFQQLEKRALQLQTAADISRAAGSTLNPEELIQQVVDLARKQFDLYYAGLFLVDQSGEWTGEPGRWAVLRAGTGDAGQKMLAQNHKLEIDGASMIGWCIANRQARIALDVGEEASRFNNPLLPNTRSEMALPLISRGQAIGALTIQSTREAAFSDEDIAILETMAGQVANAIENARLFDQVQTALKEMEAVHQRYLQQEWAEYLKAAKGAMSCEVRHPDSPPLSGRMQPEIQQVLEREKTAATDGRGKGNLSTLIAPITFRGVTIGALGIYDEDKTRRWNDGEIALIEAVAERMALAAENLRLLDESLHSAARERLTREITDKMRRTADLETLMQITLHEAAPALAASGAFVQLAAPSGPAEEPSGEPVTEETPEKAHEE